MEKRVCIVTPTYNEAENIRELYERIASVMSQLPYNYDHICIDNQSTDATVAILKSIAKRDPRLKIIVNARNFGYIRSSFYGILQSDADATVLMASDLQDPPEIIPELLEQWEAGFKSVLAVKPQSEESMAMRGIRKLFYKAIETISEVSLVKNATGSGLFDRQVVDIMRELDDPYPYFRGLVCEIGLPITTVPFRQPRRQRGITSQNLYSYYDMAMLGITKHSKVPLRVMTFSGFVLAAASILVALGYLIAKILFWNSFVLGTAPLLVGMFLFIAMQMLFIGLLGEYIGTIQTHVRKLPLVIESERINC